MKGLVESLKTWWKRSRTCRRCGHLITVPAFAGRECPRCGVQLQLSRDAMAVLLASMVGWVRLFAVFFEAALHGSRGMAAVSVALVGVVILYVGGWLLALPLAPRGEAPPPTDIPSTPTPGRSCPACAAKIAWPASPRLRYDHAPRGTVLRPYVAYVRATCPRCGASFRLDPRAITVGVVALVLFTTAMVVSVQVSVLAMLVFLMALPIAYVVIPVVIVRFAPILALPVDGARPMTPTTSPRPVARPHTTSPAPAPRLSMSAREASEIRWRRVRRPYSTQRRWLLLGFAVVWLSMTGPTALIMGWAGAYMLAEGYPFDGIFFLGGPALVAVIGPALVLAAHELWLAHLRVRHRAAMDALAARFGGRRVSDTEPLAQWMDARGVLATPTWMEGGPVFDACRIRVDGRELVVASRPIGSLLPLRHDHDAALVVFAPGVAASGSREAEARLRAAGLSLHRDASGVRAEAGRHWLGCVRRDPASLGHLEPVLRDIASLDGAPRPQVVRNSIVR